MYQKNQASKQRAAALRKIATDSNKVGRHIAEKMAVEAERAALKVESESSTKL